MIKSVKHLAISQLLHIEGSIVYQIPRYQREYTWKKNHCETLFDDIQENDSGYFLGSIICIDISSGVREIRELELVDGQQRLTTLSLLFAAIYQYMNSHVTSLTEEQKVEMFNLKRKLILTREGNKERLIPQMQNNNQDDYFYILHEVGIVGERNRPQNAGNRKIFRTFRYFKSRLEKMAGPSENHLDVVFDFLDKINKASLVEIEVTSHADAYTLFESLNNRGAPLTGIDLIKNKLLAELDRTNADNIDECFKIWARMLNYLGDDYSIQERFFRQYYNAFKSELNQPFKTDGENDPLGPVAMGSNLIKIYEKLIEHNAEGFLREIREAAKFYSLLLNDEDNPNKHPFPDHLAKLARPLKNLERIQGAPSHLLMLYILRKHENISANVACDIVDLLVSFFVRRNLTQVPPTYDLTRLFMGIAEKIRGKPESQLMATIHKELSSVSANDDAFSSMLRGSIYDDNVGVTRFILCAIEESHWTRESWRDLWVYEGKNLFWTIEHIFPQGENIPDSWVAMMANGDAATAKEIQEEHVHKLGNLTISGFNSALGNKSFVEKKNRTDKDGRNVGYGNGLTLNAELVDADKWSVEQIESRTAKLADEALALFKI